MIDTSFSRRTLLQGLAMASVGNLTTALWAQASSYPVYGRVERLDAALDALIDKDAIVEELIGGFAWAEGPVWVGGASGMILVSDPRGNFIASWQERTGGTRWLSPSGYEGEPRGLSEPGTNGLFLGRGGLVTADSGNRRIGRIDLQTKRKTSIADRFEGKRFNSPNDLCVSPRDGSIYFTDPPYGLTGGADSSEREMDYTGIFRVDRNNRVSLIEREMRPNGIGISPDGLTLYHTDGAQGWIAHTLDESGRSTGQRIFIDRAAENFTGNSGDGFKVDQAGNLWLSGRDGISIVNPTGHRLGIIRLNDSCANCEIGADGHLYIASHFKLARVKVKARKLRA
jgi:gluconolactonase